MKILEVCADSLDSVKAAIEGGASRVELCSGLAEGGVTPSAAFIRAAVGTGIKVNVLIRPRGGDFVYSAEEAELILDDIRTAVSLGANGVVTGALCTDGSIDEELCRRMAEAAGGKELTFHRAFDVCRDPEEALRLIAEMGYNRILTSGLASSAEKGIPMLRKLQEKASGSGVIIMAGCGVNSCNAGDIARLSGVTELHASARHRLPSAMTFRNSSVSMGTPGSDEYSRYVTDPKEVRAIIEAINS